MKRTALKRKMPLRKVSRQRATVAQLDALWSRVVRQRAGGKCIVPGCEHTKLYGCHIWPKGAYPALRHDPANGFAACWYHHMGPRSWHKDPQVQVQILLELDRQRTAKKMDALLIASRTRRRPDKEAIRIALEMELARTKEET